MKERQAQTLATCIPQDMPNVEVHIQQNKRGSHAVIILHKPTTLTIKMYRFNEWKEIKQAWMALEEKA